MKAFCTFEGHDFWGGRGRILWTECLCPPTCTEALLDNMVPFGDAASER